MKWQERRESERVQREMAQGVAWFRSVNAELTALVASNDENAYNAVYESKWTPYYVNLKRSIGGELTAAVVRKAIAAA